ncbi:MULTISPECIES: sugar phosphate isomerase/epimerase family protein [unclassified Jeotgalibaca]|uniref:sugar phosphate isomerase/epimerase family protein n=1 Tax=unclassified Jeotgalibaca TaxID=2621505 RepID=UPI003FD38022
MIRLTGVNTLVFNDELTNSSKQQWEYFSELAKIGVPFIEVRREFIRDFEVELLKTNKEASKLGLALLYSIPSTLFFEGKVNKELTSFLKEAKELGAIQIKLTIGDYRGFNPELVSELKEIFDKFPDVRVSIENDQSIENGSIQALQTFMESALANGLNFGLTFDTGNFVYIDEEPLTAASKLNKYVNYIHIKNVTRTKENNVEMTLFQNGDIPIKEVMKAIDEEERVIAAIEYPCGSTDEAMAILKQQFNLITQ